MSSTMTIKQRLMLFVFLVCGIQLIVAAFVFSQLASTEVHIKGVAHRDIPVIAALSKATEHQLEQRIAYNKAFRYALEVGVEPNAEEKYRQQVEDFHALGKGIADEWKDIRAQLTIDDTFTEEEKVAFSEALLKLNTIVEQHTLWQIHVEEVFSELEGKHYHEAEVLDETVGAEAARTTKLVESLLVDIEIFTEEAVIGIEKQARLLEWLVAVAAVVSTIIAVIMSKIILARIYRGLNKVSAALAIQAGGDFSREGIVDEPGIIGELQKNMEGTRKSTNAMIAKVANEVSEAADALDKSTHAVKHNAHSQTQEISQIVTAFSEMLSSAQDVASNSSKTQEATESASGQSSESMRINEESMNQIHGLIDTLTQSSKVLEELEKNSGSISSVLDVIKGIAEQTNLLALNAAIEAARAGEEGRGFAVVADEVRSLAQRTHDSTSEIETMFEQLNNATHDAVETIRKSCQMGDRTIELSRQSSTYLAQAGNAIGQVTDMNRRVAQAAEEQSGVVGDVNVNLNKVRDMADESMHEVELLVEATGSLNAIAQNLQASVGRTP